ncbi:hypothetical protein ACIPJ2_04360 [Curtobacterium sp. NPDC090217]|uniref:hypothetical protein n=1 Tax=Curtobacterium sp. NPDC090217 TaxID=3363970 RepID=UPI00380096FD
MPEKVIVEWENLLDLVLDESNPRHEPTTDRNAIIRQMVEKESVLPLARDIVRVDGISPLDVFAGIREGDHIIVLDGNRRLTALLLLHDPSLAPAKERPAFKALSESFEGNVAVEVAVFPTRDEANVWIERKHQGFNNGLGMRDWNAVQNARFMGSRSNNALALRLLDYALEHRIITPEQRAQRVITTVTRYVGNTVFRVEGLGITTSRSEPDFRHAGTVKLFRARLARFFEDLYAERGPVTSRSTASERANYARAVLLPLDPKIAVDTSATTSGDDSAASPPPTSNDRADTSGATTDSSGAASDPPGEPDSTAGSASGGTTKAGPHGARKYFLADSSRFATSNSKVQRIIDELGRTDRQHPLAAALLARVFLESVFFRYAEHVQERTISDRDKQHVIIKEALEHFRGQRAAGGPRLSRDERSALELFRNLVTNQTWVFSGFYLGAVAHGQAFPEWRELTSRWDEIEAVVVAVVAKLG